MSLRGTALPQPAADREPLAPGRGQFAYLEVVLPAGRPRGSSLRPGGPPAQGEARATSPASGQPSYREERYPAGVLLLDQANDKLYLKLRQDWETVSPEEADILQLLEADLQQMATQFGGEATLARLEDQLSHLLRITPRQETLCYDFEARLRRLYREMLPGEVKPYQTHVPFFPVKAAAGYLSGEMTTETASDWLPLPEGVRPSAELFAVQIDGRSMEPKIPDGSIALFRKIGAGSRQGKIVLVERFGYAANAGQYTVKVYSSQKRSRSDAASPSDGPGRTGRSRAANSAADPDDNWAGSMADGDEREYPASFAAGGSEAAWENEGTWEHLSVRMSPLNPEFESWDLRPDEFRILGEFVCLLPAEE